MRYVALLRGVNLGGKNKVPMRDLVRLVEAAGGKDVVTYIQSGNVVFDAPARVAARMPAALTRAIEAELGCRVPVVLRTADEIRAAATEHPFLARGESPDRLHVVFLADAPSKAAVASLDPSRSPRVPPKAGAKDEDRRDELVVRGRDVFLFLPNGVARSKLTNDWFDRKLGTVSTARNLRTVQKLAELALLAHRGRAERA